LKGKNGRPHFGNPGILVVFCIKCFNCDTTKRYNPEWNKDETEVPEDPVY